MTAKAQPEITVAEAAEIRGVSRERIRALIDEGRLPARLVGGIYLVDRKAVVGFKPRPGGRPRKERRA